MDSNFSMHTAFKDEERGAASLDWAEVSEVRGKSDRKPGLLGGEEYCQHPFGQTKAQFR